MRKYKFEYVRVNGEEVTQYVKAYDKKSAVRSFYGRFTINGIPSVKSISVQCKDGSFKELKKESPVFHW